jgi:hypothetical protein|tara:strand:+ start:27291 stop:27647 length:357 start_codon:yes stop_codon:yes gene_type:complete
LSNKGKDKKKGILSFSENPVSSFYKWFIYMALIIVCVPLVGGTIKGFLPKTDVTNLLGSTSGLTELMGVALGFILKGVSDFLARNETIIKMEAIISRQEREIIRLSNEVRRMANRKKR